MRVKISKDFKLYRNFFVNRKPKTPNIRNKHLTRIVIIIMLSAIFTSLITSFQDQGVVNAANFSGDYRVDDTGTATTIQWTPTIARASNGDVYVAWYDTRGGFGSGMYFAKSTDGGKTFSKNVLVNDSTTFTYTVFIHNKYMAVDNSGGANDGNIYIAWEDLRNDPFMNRDYDIYFARSTDGGNTFGTNIRIGNDTGTYPQVRPSMVVDNTGTIYTVWTDLQDTKNPNSPDLNLYFSKSTNGGITFSNNIRVDDGGKSMAEGPAIAVNETGVIYVAWHDTRNVNADIYVSKSTNGGTSFGTSTRVTDTSFATNNRLSFPSIITSGSNVYVTWGDNQSGNWDIRMAYSTNGGTTWSTPIKVNDDIGSSEQYYPDIAIDKNNTIYVAWQDARNNNIDIYSANSTNGGSTFGASSRVDHDTTSGYQRYPSIVAEPNGGIYLAWEDWRNDSDGKYVSGGGTDGVNNANIYLAFGGKPLMKFSSVIGRPPTPENLKVSLIPTGSGLDISWDKLNVQDLGNYTLYWSMDGNTYGKLVDVPANSTILRHSHTGLLNGLTYYYKISVTNNNGNESNLSLAVANIPDIDTDLDGVGNENDWDDDGDSISDFQDDFPLDVTRTKDTDGDGLDDNLDDEDDDNDGYSDLIEILLFTDTLSSGSKPADFDNDYIPDIFDNDIDNDGTDNSNDDLDFNPYEISDPDNDNFGNNSDPDDDNDGYSDFVEDFCGTNRSNSSSFPKDTDADGIPDKIDTDDDNDNFTDDNDAFPKDPLEWLDTDGDNTGDNSDSDDDGDTIIDANDQFPKDPTEWDDFDGDGLGDNFDVDDDNDGVPDNNDAFPKDPTEWLDTDDDGLGDNIDTDDDNDGITDDNDAFPKDPLEWLDTDGDGLGDNFDIDDDNDDVNDDNDAFPQDDTEHLDSDGDNVGDNEDDNDDNDDITDDDDPFPTDPSEWIDTDGDGLGDNFDIDDDNDGITDDNDAFPKDKTEYQDTDDDNVGDNSDNDDDEDNVKDSEDKFPKDPTEWDDFDGDGLGDNFDLDDDNDGITDDNDAFPLDPKEWSDTDGDGVGDNTDDDDDNDNIPDINDEFEKDPSEYIDLDGDGLGDNFDPDDDNDGIPDDLDAFPNYPFEWLDTDGDGIGNNIDNDDDNDSVDDIKDEFPLDPKEIRDSDRDGIGDNLDQDDDNDGVIDVHDYYPLDSSRSKQPEGVNELWVPIMLIIVFAVMLLILILIIFNNLHKHQRKTTQQFENIGNVMKLVESRFTKPVQFPPREGIIKQLPPGGQQELSKPDVLVGLPPPGEQTNQIKE
jgi:hypothetical protein